MGASIRYGKHSLKIQNFIKENKKILDNIKTAFFSVNVVASNFGEIQMTEML